MRETFSDAQPLRENHGAGLRWLLLLLLSAWAGFGSSLVCGQDLPLRPESKPTSSLERERRALREQWFLRGRSSRAQPGAGFRYQAYLQKMRMRAARLAAAQKAGNALPPAAAAWSPLGPAPLASDASGSGEFDYGWVSGRATAVAADPADATGNTVYIGGAYGGVWKSTNAASQSVANVVWQPLTDDQATLAVGAIAIQPGNSGVILVGTGETSSSVDSYYGLGILRSADAGMTWTLIPSDSTGSRPFAGMGFSKIAFSGNSPNWAVAATAGTPEGIIEDLENPLTANLGLYYSADSGASWRLANVSDGGSATAPGSASSVVYNASAGQFFAALRYHGFYSSSDNGQTWTRLLNQPGLGLSVSACPASPSTSSCPIYRGEIAVVPGRNEMYVWYVDANDFDQGIYETTDGGNSWVQINDAGIINCGDELGCGTEQGTYNLELAAVPDGGATDLYAGAINLYKCQVTSYYPTCNGPGLNTFLNLTHAYGCSAIAKVHPAQHAVSFLVNSSNQAVMYFANDGGIYRALDGYGLLTATCGGSNPFDSLNLTLGSMTQFVSFSQASADASTLLGGTQGNGSPGTRSGAGSWQNVNFGDGGYTQISPDNEDEWFVSNPPNAISGVNIFSCASGPNCHTQDFQNNPVVSSATLGGDTGGYDPPFILDPLSSGELIVGTCRMWRGPASGGVFTVLSHSFETGGDGICTGGEVNLIRSLATGLLDKNTGFSKVMYAGTDGFGPLVPTTPLGGHVWVSTNVAAGLSTWTDQTGTINPNTFPISGIAMDSSDTQGLTAYVGIMGFSSASFPTSHLWQTTNGGSSWTDYTANLPNAPVNAVAVDPTTTGSPGRVYVATDVGVFWSFTVSPNWQEVGPAANSGQAGFLPNVAVTALGVFTQQDSRKLLRASTYGRGVWEFPLSADYSLAISNSPIIVFPSQSIPPFNGTITALGGYNARVDLSCTGISTCSAAPTFVNPPAPPPGTPLTATVSATPAPGDYVFDLHGSGEDSYHIQNDAFFTLKVEDFNLTIPQPDSITVPPGTVSAPIGFQVTAAGSFASTVDLSCDPTTLPAGASCNFQPGTVNPTANNPAAVTLTISATTSASPGTFLVTIDGSVPSMPEAPTRTQTLSLTIPKDYSLAISNPALQADITEGGTAPVYYNGTLTSLNGYSSLVNLSCGAGATAYPVPTCSASPTPQRPTTNGAKFKVEVVSDQCSPPNTPPHTPFQFNIVAQGTDSSQTSHSVPVTFTATSIADGFTLGELTPASNTAHVNTPAQFSGALVGTVCYYYPVHLSCGSNAPPTCQFSPATLAPSVGNGTPFRLTVSSDVAATYSFLVTAQGSDPNAITNSVLANFTSTGNANSAFSFTITPPTSLQSLPAGQPANYDLDVAPTGGLFPRDAVLAFSDNCPPLSVCSLSATQVNRGSGATHVTFTIQTTAPVVADSMRARRMIYALWLWLPGLIVAFGGMGRSCKQRKRFAVFCLLALMVPVLWLGLGCGGGLQGNGTGNGQAGTPSGTYTMTVSATMSGLPQQTAQVELTVN